MIPDFKSEFLKKTIFALVAKGNSAIISFIFSLVVANYFPAEIAGSIFLYLTIILILSTIFKLGAEISIVKKNSHLEVSNIQLRYSNNLSIAFNSAVFFIVCISFLYLTDCFFDVLKFDFYEVFVIVLCGFVHTLTTVIAYDFQSRKSTYLFNFINSGILPLFLVFVIWIFSFKNASHLIIAGVLSSFLFTIGFYLVIFRKEFKYIRSGINIHPLTNLKESLRFLPITSLSILTTWLTQLYVAYYLSDTDVAVMSVTQRVSMLLGFIVIAVNSIAAPNYAISFAKNKLSDVKVAYYNSVKMCVVFGFIPSLVVIFFPKQILVLFGSEYAAYSTLLLIFSIGQIFNIVTGSVGQLLQMTGKENKSLLSMIVAFFTNFILLFVLVEPFGLIGAALSYSIAYSIQNLLNCYFVISALNEMENNKC